MLRALSFSYRSHGQPNPGTGVQQVQPCTHVEIALQLPVLRCGWVHTGGTQHFPRRWSTRTVSSTQPFPHHQSTRTVFSTDLQNVCMYHIHLLLTQPQHTAHSHKLMHAYMYADNTSSIHKHGVHTHTGYRRITCIYFCVCSGGGGGGGGDCVFARTEAWSTVLLLARRHWAMHNKSVKYAYATQCTAGSSLWLFHHFVGWLRKRTLVAVNRASFLLAMDQFHWPWPASLSNIQWLLPHIM